MFSLEERNIFRYFNGTYADDGSPREVWGDPMAIGRKFMVALGAEDPGAVLKSFDNALSNPNIPPQATVPVIENVLAAIRSAFDVAAMGTDGTGLTDAECIDLLQTYLGWREEVAKKSDASPKSSPPTASTPGDSGGASPSTMRPSAA